MYALTLLVGTRDCGIILPRTLFWRNAMRILVTGGSGMVGQALKRFLPDAMYVNSNAYDLTDQHETSCMIGCDPDVVIHLAAKVGGIIANSFKQYDFFTENALINTHLVEACAVARIPRLIALSSTCAYPAHPPKFPITEDMLHLGPPEQTNYGYAHAKRMMQVQIQAAREQYGFNWSVIYPSNLYGPGDCFDLQRCHVVPAMIRKFHEAKMQGRKSVDLLGSGAPCRQFTYVDDLARFLADFATRDIAGDFNFCNTQSWSMSSLANAVREVTGFGGDHANWSGSFDGVARKDVSIDKLSKVCPVGGFTPLHEGLATTYQWFREYAV